MMPLIRATQDGASLAVRAQPGARKSRIVGVHDGSLKVAVSAPPEDGRANDALIELLARTLGIRENRIRLSQGRSDRRKVFDIIGMTPDELGQALQAVLQSVDPDSAGT
jgi:uncharacterized protein (TIGR00251 family)